MGWSGYLPRREKSNFLFLKLKCGVFVAILSKTSK